MTFQAQNTETILKSCCVLQDHYDDERDKTVFHNTTPDLQDHDRLRAICLVSDRSCPKTDGLKPHHWTKKVPLTILVIENIILYTDCRCQLSLLRIYFVCLFHLSYYHSWRNKDDHYVTDRYIK